MYARFLGIEIGARGREVTRGISKSHRSWIIDSPLSRSPFMEYVINFRGEFGRFINKKYTGSSGKSV